MAIVFAILAGVIVGAGMTGYWLSRRWQTQVREAEQALQEIARQHRDEQDNSRQLQQQLADVKFRLNQAQNELRALRSDGAPASD